MKGCDLHLIKSIAETVDIPVIACGERVNYRISKMQLG